MPDGGTVHTKPVTDAPLPAASPAVRAAMRIALRHGCALTRDAAEQITEAILGCAGVNGATPVTEWGARRPDRASGVFNAGSDDGSEKMARLIAGDQERRGISGALLRRTVIYGPWEQVAADGGSGQITTEDATR